MTENEIMNHIVHYVRNNKNFVKFTDEQKNIIMPLILTNIKPEIKKVNSTENDSVYLPNVEKFIDNVIIDIYEDYKKYN